MRIILATHNKGKLAELQSILEEQLGAAASGKLNVVSADELHLADPVETGTSFEENALLKARAVAEETGCPAIADDSGLIVDILGKAPGILSARWAGVHGDDAANNALLLRQLADIPYAARTARFMCCAALVVPAGVGVDAGAAGSAVTGAVTGASDAETGVVTADTSGQNRAGSEPSGAASGEGWEVVRFGEMPGRLLRVPRGENGFGYDPLFVPDEQQTGRSLTSAEMTADRKNAISHRGKAFRALAPAIALLAR